MSGRGLNQFGRGGLPPMLRNLLIANGAVYLLSLFYVFSLEPGSGAMTLRKYFFLSAEGVASGYIWQPFTYMFLHDLVDPWHLLLNMFVLWMFGTMFEPTWGSRRFLNFYLLCGLGGGAAVVILGLLFPGVALFAAPVLGASAAVLGFVVAYGVTFPDRYVLLFFVIPVQGRYIAPATVVIDLLAVFYFNQPIAAQAHLGGMLTAYLLLTGYWRPSRLMALPDRIRAKRRHTRMRKDLRDAFRR